MANLNLLDSSMTPDTPKFADHNHVSFTKDVRRIASVSTVMVQLGAYFRIAAR